MSKAEMALILGPVTACATNIAVELELIHAAAAKWEFCKCGPEWRLVHCNLPSSICAASHNLKLD
jgi:hypothetical protein